MIDDTKTIEAKRQVNALKGFLIHLTVFGIVMSGLVVLNFATQPPWWVQWPLLGWGIGLASHAIIAFTPFRLFGRDWEERRVQRYLDRRPR